MKENNLSQLVGALGGWLQARPYGAEQDALDRAARIVLDMRLLGLDIDDVDAPELAELSPEDRDVVEQARVWAQARREEARRRRAADERAARHRRVAEREAGPNEAFAWPARPSVRDETPPPAPASAAEPLPELNAPEPEPEVEVEPVAQAAAVADEPGAPAAFAEPEADVVGHLAGAVVDADQSIGGSSVTLADPSDHAFFEVDDVVGDTGRAAGAAPGTRRRVRPEAVFKVVIVIWSIAALGVLAVLLRIALG